jgi:TetR/AcrR family transcriptional repressor of nem operon
LVDYYLSDQHRDARALSCPVAALASETSRQSDAVRKSFGDGVEGLVEVLSEAMPETDPEDRRQSALVAFSAMVGSVMLSRAVGDQTLADEFLQASRIAFARQGEE